MKQRMSKHDYNIRDNGGRGKGGTRRAGRTRDEHEGVSDLLFGGGAAAADIEAEGGSTAAAAVRKFVWICCTVLSAELRKCCVAGSPGSSPWSLSIRWISWLRRAMARSSVRTSRWESADFSAASASTSAYRLSTVSGMAASLLGRACPAFFDECRKYFWVSLRISSVSSRHACAED